MDFYGKHASILSVWVTYNGWSHSTWWISVWLSKLQKSSRRLAVSRCRTACLHVTIYLCLQTVCLCHWLSIFCMASFFSGVYLSACSNLLSQRQLSWSHLSVITVRSSGCRMTSLTSHRRELGSWRQTGSRGFTHGVNPERSLDELI